MGLDPAADEDAERFGGWGRKGSHEEQCDEEKDELQESQRLLREAIETGGMGAKEFILMLSLTPALSRWERENIRQTIGESRVVGTFVRYTLLFPLPQGEG
jgi:hypothetical protein